MIHLVVFCSRRSFYYFFFIIFSNVPHTPFSLETRWMIQIRRAFIQCIEYDVMWHSSVSDISFESFFFSTWSTKPSECLWLRDTQNHLNRHYLTCYTNSHSYYNITFRAYERCFWISSTHFAIPREHLYGIIY